MPMRTEQQNSVMTSGMTMRCISASMGATMIQGSPETSFAMTFMRRAVRSCDCTYVCAFSGTSRAGK